MYIFKLKIITLRSISYLRWKQLSFLQFDIKMLIFYIYEYYFTLSNSQIDKYIKLFYYALSSLGNNAYHYYQQTQLDLLLLFCQ